MGFLYDPLKNVGTSATDKILLKSQCSACPFLRRKEHPDPNYEKLSQDGIEILIIGSKSTMPIKGMYDRKTYYATDVECAGVSESLEDTKGKAATMCCAGRKLKLIDAIKPKLVIAIGVEVLKLIEVACGLETFGLMGIPLPTAHNGFPFWLLGVPDEQPKSWLLGRRAFLEACFDAPPKVLTGNYQGIEFVTNTKLINLAFDDLERQVINGFDIETECLRPYKDDPRMLSIAIGTFEKTYAFPVRHRQTPSAFDSKLVMERLYALPKSTRLIGHHVQFELEWLMKLLGPKWAYSGVFDDTLLQAFLLYGQAPKSLDACIRRSFGFNLKKISNVNVEKLDEYPLEKVLSYNALDTKYTHLLFKVQQDLIAAQDLGPCYRMQADRARAIALMQSRGLLPNPEFLIPEIAKQESRWREVNEVWSEFSEVKSAISKFGKCEPLSNLDIANLFHNFFGVSQYVTSFNDEFLEHFDHPISKIILDIRETNKILNTWLRPILPNHPGCGEMVHPDGLIHSSHFVKRSARLASSDINYMAWPSTRSGFKYIRSGIKAPPGKLKVAVDQGQIEYRIAAALSKDKVMCDGLWQKPDFDVHMYWTLHIVGQYDGVFVVDPNIKSCKDLGKKCVGKVNGKHCCLKDFRSTVKNTLVFPNIYLASYRKTADRFGMGDQADDFKKKVIDPFWEVHSGLRTWQEGTLSFYNRNGYTRTPFGRRFHGPMKETEIVNLPIQSTAVEISLVALEKLATLSVELDTPDLCPVHHIHDDNGFDISEEYFDDCIDLIKRVMLHTKSYEDWLGVPLSIEISTGPDWGKLTEFGVYRSDELDLQ